MPHTIIEFLSMNGLYTVPETPFISEIHSIKSTRNKTFVSVELKNMIISYCLAFSQTDVLRVNDDNKAELDA